MKNGKYYITPNGEPYFNMAFDEWLFERMQASVDNCKAIIRLYSWSAPAITIGYNQDIERAVDFSNLDNAKTNVIRRITGGRAIYHDPDELTYTIMFDLAIFPGDFQTIAQSSRLISDIFVKIFDKIGIKSKWALKSDDSFEKANGVGFKSCFDSLSRFEILSDRAKIAAGAQRRVGNHFIQQGSLKVNGISGCSAIGQSEKKFEGRHSDESREGKKYVIDDLSRVFGDMFSENLGIFFEKSILNQGEKIELDYFSEKFKLEMMEKR